MVLVAKKKAKDDAGSLVMTFRCDSDLHNALNKFQNEQRIKPSKAEILIVALQEFLQREGFYSGDESAD